MHNYGKTREDQKRERSKKASRAANARWDQYHASCPEPDYGMRPDNMYRITVENLMDGEKHVLLFHLGSRANNYRVDVDGKPWKICGWTGAIDRLRKSCDRMGK